MGAIEQSWDSSFQPSVLRFPGRPASPVFTPIQPTCAHLLQLKKAPQSTCESRLLKVEDAQKPDGIGVLTSNN